MHCKTVFLILKQDTKETQEAQKHGSVSLRAYFAYFTSGSGYFGLILVVFFFIAAQAMIISADYLLSIWY